MKNKDIILIITGFSLVIIILNLLIKNVLYTDVGDYLAVAKYFSNNIVSRIRSTHSWVYGLFLSQFLKIWSSVFLVKLVNSSFLVFTAVLLYNLTKDKKVLFLWILSPVVWYMTPQISPILPSAFLLLLSYKFIKEYESKEKLKYLIYSALPLGLSSILWDSMIPISIFFILVFFFNRRLKEILFFGVFYFIAFSIRFILDYYLFSYPFFSLFRFFGGSLLVYLRQGNYTHISNPVLNYILYLVIISPFLFKIYKLNFKEYKKELIFLLLTVLMFISSSNQLRYFLILAPISILLISKVMTKKELVLNSILSVLLILFLLYPSFVDNSEKLIQEDLNQIAKDFPNEVFFAGNEQEGDAYLVYSLVYWGKEIKEIISWQDLQLVLSNKTNFQQYRYESKAKVGETRNVWLEFGVSRADNRTYEYVDYLISSKKETSLKNFKLVKSYKTLNVFKKDTTKK
ncbi:hypothetical protein HYV88_00180 [Candidatus Woesearchaeota archaeon]|nr:hypothetical protein [Candidatus Woesearchaeota archaeon]